MRKILSTTIIVSALIMIHSNSAHAQEMGTKVYWMVTTEVPLGKLQEFHAYNGNELTPIMEKHGYKVIVTWQTIVGDIQEVVSVAEFENMSAYHKARRSLLGSEEWQKASKRFNDLVIKTKTRFLSAAPYSKMK